MVSVGPCSAPKHIRDVCPAVRTEAYYQKGQNFFNNPCPFLQWLHGKQQKNVQEVLSIFMQNVYNENWTFLTYTKSCMYYSGNCFIISLKLN